MAARGRFLTGADDHGKKDGFGPPPRRTGAGLILLSLRSVRRRRVALGLLAVWLLYLFIKNIPTDLPPVSERYDVRYGRLQPPFSPHVPDHSADGNGDQSYDGPIKFYQLGTTLRKAAMTYTSKANVLFAVSDLRTIPYLLPLACEMAQHDRSVVHFALMGRDEAQLDTVMATNGIVEAECPIVWHDGRPDFALQSSRKRMEVSTRASLGHMYSALRLQAVLVCDSDLDESYFLAAMKEKAAAVELPLIVLPIHALSSLSWISSLDGTSLKHWNHVHVDIVVHAVSESSGPLLRLLRSIKEADYAGWPLPRITIELPPHVDPFVTNHLSHWSWPPDAPAGDSKLVLRRRIDTTHLTPAHASLRTIESFYPTTPTNSHALVLSPDIELSPGYFHFLMYILLEYHHGGRTSDRLKRLLGISLDVPHQALDRRSRSPISDPSSAEPVVMWQAPNSNAALYFGDKWLELHTFLSHRLAADPQMTKSTASAPTIAPDYPAWLHATLEMMRAKNYYMLYPAFTQGNGSPVVTVHRELHRPAEEYDGDTTEVKSPAENAERVLASLADSHPLLADDEMPLPEAEKPVLADSFVSSLLERVSNGKPIERLVNTLEIPLFSYSGSRMNLSDSQTESARFAEDLAHSVGGCTSWAPSERGAIESFFCLPTSP